MIDSYKEAEENEALLFSMGFKQNIQEDQNNDEESSEDEQDESSFNLRTLNLN